MSKFVDRFNNEKAQITERVVKLAKRMCDLEMPLYGWDARPISHSIHYQLFCQDVFYEPIESWAEALADEGCEEQAKVESMLNDLWIAAFGELGMADVVEELARIDEEGL